MTTICYDGNGLICTDGRSTRNTTIISDNKIKQKIVNDVQFYLTGSTSDFNYLIDAYFGAEMNMKLDASGFAVDNGLLYSFGPDGDNKNVWVCDEDMTIPNAIGSGADHALTAMDLGCTAREAVEAAIKRDSGSGGTIRVYDIKTGDEVVE